MLARAFSLDAGVYTFEPSWEDAIACATLVQISPSRFEAIEF